MWTRSILPICLCVCMSICVLQLLLQRPPSWMCAILVFARPTPAVPIRTECQYVHVLPIITVTRTWGAVTPSASPTGTACAARRASETSAWTHVAESAPLHRNVACTTTYQCATAPMAFRAIRSRAALPSSSPVSSVHVVPLPSLSSVNPVHGVSLPSLLPVSSIHSESLPSLRVKMSVSG